MGVWRDSDWWRFEVPAAHLRCRMLRRIVGYLWTNHGVFLYRGNNPLLTAHLCGF